MNIMKHIALVTLLATSLVAQQANEAASRDARLELAKIIAVEEQEQDLAKAEQLYRAALKDQKISVAARGLARQRLGQLLRRLGKHAEARKVLNPKDKGEVVSLDDVTNGDVQQQKRFLMLQLQARALIEDARKNQVPVTAAHRSSQGSVSEQLLWIGRAAVPEVIAALDAVIDNPPRTNLTNELVRFLWQQGGPNAEKFLQSAAQTALADTAAHYSGLMKVVDIDAPVVRAYMDHKNWPLAHRFLMGQRGGGLVGRLSAAQLLQFAERGDDQRKSYVLSVLRSRELTDPERKRAYALCRLAEQGANPAFGGSAEVFIASHQSQQAMEGLRMLFAILPDLHERGVAVGNYWKRNTPAAKFDSEQSAQLLPMIRECVQKIGPVKNPTTATRWLQNMMGQMPQDAGLPCVQLLIEMWDLGYDVVFALTGRATKETAVALLDRFDRVHPQNLWTFCNAFADEALTPEALPKLRAITESVGWWSGNELLTRWLVGRAAHTGTADAAGFVLEAWAKPRKPGNGRKNDGVLVGALVDLAKTVRTEPVRSAMRKMARADGGPKIEPRNCARLMLALMTMGDEAALEWVADGVGDASAVHPYASKPRVRGMRPVKYLIYREPNPPHDYSNAQVLDAVTGYAKKFGATGLKNLPSRQMDLARVSDEVVAVLAQYDDRVATDSWRVTALKRFEKQLDSGTDATVLERWFRMQAVVPNDSFAWFAEGGPKVGARCRDVLTKAFDDGDDLAAAQAFSWLWRLDRSVDLAVALKHAQTSVRASALQLIVRGQAKVDSSHVIPLLADANEWLRHEAAVYLGALVYKPAVPALIQQLRDPADKVRKAAADALTRIRFYHEQQAHWDRVLKGLDASPASAAEKLLVQAKPDAKKSQRLLAIKSLGVLGVPEALPFLIEWSQEGDGDIAAAATAAITAIHLSPRK